MTPLSHKTKTTRYTITITIRTQTKILSRIPSLINITLIIFILLKNWVQSLFLPPLSKNNYKYWIHLMKRDLLSKNNIKFNNGKLTAPQEDDPLFDTWEIYKIVLLSWISTSLSPDISQSMIYVDNATQLWTDLHNKFFKSDHFHLSNLLQQIHSTSQGDKSVTVYFNELKPLWEDL